MRLTLALILATSIVWGYGRKNDPAVTTVARDEGDTPIFFDVACDPQQWTVVVASDTIRRSMFAELASLGTVIPVCLATFTGSTINCDKTTPGIDLGTASVSSVTIYTKNAWNCRTAFGSGATGTIKGYFGRDKRDNTGIPAEQ